MTTQAHYVVTCPVRAISVGFTTRHDAEKWLENCKTEYPPPRGTAAPELYTWTEWENLADDCEFDPVDAIDGIDMPIINMRN